MNRPISPPRRGSMFFSDAYRDWCPTQSWLVEAIRAAATTLYAKATDEGSNTKSFAVHRGAISGQLSRTFAAILDDALPELSIPVGIDLLVLLKDFAQIGQGYCVPRESRIVRLARNWGRIAGGLPLYSSEDPGLRIKSIHDNTIGRVAEFIDGFDSHDRGTEHSEVFAWMGSNAEQIFAGLNQDLPDRRSSQPPEKAVVFYNAGLHRARTRGPRWQEKAQRNQFVVARTTGLPTHYFICFAKGSSSWQWFELSKEEARKWVLLVEKCAGTTNVVRTIYVGDGVRIRLRDMLPDAWTTALLACSSVVIPIDGGWELALSSNALPLVRILFESANIQLS